MNGETRKGPRRFVSGHNLRTLERTEEHKANIAAAQRRSWQTSRKRLPIGSKNTDHHGYVRVKVTEGSGPWRKEHQLVMESMIGRALVPPETVHHINGVRDDNRPENLYLCRDNAHHMAVEASMAHAFRELMASGFARFNKETGRYEGVLQR